MWTSLLMVAVLIAVEDGPLPKGHLVIAGGSATPTVVRETALRLAGGKDADVAVVAGASSIPETLAADTINRFKEIGAQRLQAVDLNRPEEAAAVLEDAELIWFTGGDQNRLTALMAGTRLPEIIRRRYRDGATIGGTSAGAAILSKLMMTGRADLDTIRNGTTQLVEGLGLWNEAIIDQHFLKRGRFNRLAGAVLDHPELLGVGIDESTAVVVSGRTFEVAGNSNVVIVDARKGRTNPANAQPGEPASAINLSVHVLKAGMRYDLDQGVVLEPIAAAENRPR